MTAYVVLHDVLGSAGHRAGEVVEFSKDHIEKMGVDVERLIGLGAIREATASEAKHSVTYGDAGGDVLQTFPAVPYAPTEPGAVTYTDTAPTSSPEPLLTSALDPKPAKK
jgi:hypothetical protein